MIAVSGTRTTPWKGVVIGLLAGWAVLVTGAVLAATWKTPASRAVIGMAMGLIVLWIGVGGIAMMKAKDRIKRWVERVPAPWGFKFVLGCIVMALLEESITTAMTNAAPWFGVGMGEAYITASANYFDVVLYHSVVVFVPLFLGWAVMLRFWRFSPFAVFILFGMTGLLCETLSFGPQNLLNFGMWILVYGLMIWLPAYGLPEDRGAKVPKWWAYPAAVVIPFLFLPSLFLLAPWLWLTEKHPNIHFPPIGAG